MNEPNPFLDPARQPELYGHASRLAGRMELPRDRGHLETGI
ncbi:hypothetical protein ACFV6E_22145 [Streptomyces sp. NPDC059785]